MRRIALVLSWCVIASVVMLAGPSYAGGYYRYDDGYSYRPHHRNVRVWYSSSCCYRRVVRHETSVRYVPVERYGYYDHPRRYGYYERPYRYRYSDYPYYRSYSASNWRDVGYTESCYLRRTRILDGRGGWVWGVRRVCY
jgi:hypothetical protein